MARLQVTTDATFGTDVEQAKGLVLVDFAAEWCAPCRVVHPVLEAIAEAYGSRLRILMMDADQNPRTVSRVGARSLPTALFYRDGTLVDRIVGAVPKQAYIARIEAYINVEATI